MIIGDGMALEDRGVSKRRVLEYLAQVDPELASQVLAEDRDPEQIIVEDFRQFRLLKYQKLKEMDLETLIIAWSFFRDVIKIALDLVATSNEMFFNRFLMMYDVVARSVGEATESEPREKLLDLLSSMVFNFMDKLDALSRASGGVGGGFKPEEWRIEIKERKKSRRKAKRN